RGDRLVADECRTNLSSARRIGWIATRGAFAVARGARLRDDGNAGIGGRARPGGITRTADRRRRGEPGSDVMCGCTRDSARRGRGARPVPRDLQGSGTGAFADIAARRAREQYASTAPP